MAQKSEPTGQSDSTTEQYQAVHTHTRDQVHLDVTKLPPEWSADLEFQELKDELPKATSFSVLVCGRTGAGKSTLVNGIVGAYVAPEGDELKSKTTEVARYDRDIDGVNVTVWDSPGLQDSSDDDRRNLYISDMQKKCSDVNLKLYCISMTNIRFPRKRSDNPDVEAMARLTKAFGSDFWKHAIVVLTFANTAELLNPPWQKMDAAGKKEKFQQKLGEWERLIRSILAEEIGVPRKIAELVVVTPAGHHDDPQLLDRDYWLSVLWFRCLQGIATPKGRAAIVRISARRIRRQDEVEPGDFKKPLKDQPLVVEGTVPRSRKSALLRLLAALGAGAGAGAGALISGAFGAAIGGPVGLALGLAAFAVLGGENAVEEAKMAAKNAKMAAEKAKAATQEATEAAGKATEAAKNAEKAAEDAKKAAEAKKATEKAKEAADEAKEAAKEANKAVKDANKAAEEARKAAEEAKKSAEAKWAAELEASAKKDAEETDIVGDTKAAEAKKDADEVAEAAEEAKMAEKEAAEAAEKAKEAAEEAEKAAKEASDAVEEAKKAAEAMNTAEVNEAEEKTIKAREAAEKAKKIAEEAKKAAEEAKKAAEEVKKVAKAHMAALKAL